MNPALRLRRLTGTDLSFADAFRAQAGWNQSLADWQRFLRMNAEGCFLAEWNGVPVGTATTTLHGENVAWVGMVLVEASHRQRGIGRALLEQCLRHLRRSGVRCIKLDATPLGKPVYEALGFQTEWTLARWESNAGSEPATPVATVKEWSPGDAARAVPLDLAAFGVSRERLLAELVRDSRRSLVAEAPDGRLAGYGLMRAGAVANYLGPIVAETEATGRALIAALHAGCGAGKMYWDIPDANVAAMGWAADHGFTRQRTLTRMYWGENLAVGNPALQYALAGPEVG